MSDHSNPHSTPDNDAQPTSASASWFDSSERLVIFGDSYSVFSFWPGEENGEKTWAGCLQDRWKDTDRKIINMSVPGVLADEDMEIQLGKFFYEYPPKDATSSKTTYVFFLGINDCGAFMNENQSDLSNNVKKIFKAAEQLYVEAHARKFIFIDVPPTERSPLGAEYVAIALKNRIETWNTCLRTVATNFHRQHAESDVFLFSFHAALSSILDHPEEYNFTKKDTQDVGGAIWMDGLHLTAAVHRIIVDKLLQGTYGSQLRSD